MASRAGLPLAVALCVAGAALVLLAASQPWVVAVVDPGPPLPPSREPLTGAAVVPPVPALGWVALAGAAALLATRRTGRLVVGALLLLAGAGTALLAAGALLDARAALPALAAGGTAEPAVRSLEQTVWSLPAVVGGGLVAAAGLLTAVRGRSWSAMPGRYDAPGAPRPAEPRRRVDPDAAAWEALDRGEDPTAGR